LLLFEGVDGLLVGLTEGAWGLTEGAVGLTEGAVGLTEGAVGLTEGAVGLTEANKGARKANAVRTRLKVEDTKGAIRVGAGALAARNTLRAGALGEDAAARCTRGTSIALGRPLNAKTGSTSHPSRRTVCDSTKTLVLCKELNATKRTERADNRDTHVTENLIGIRGVGANRGRSNTRR